LLVLVVANVEETSAIVTTTWPYCNLNGFWPCYNVVQGMQPPFPSCDYCNVVRIMDKNWLCNALLSRSYPP
jgi:hypothetical protein